jgi:hypothetical protein
MDSNKARKILQRMEAEDKASPNPNWWETAYFAAIRNTMARQYHKGQYLREMPGLPQQVFVNHGKGRPELRTANKQESS